MRFLIEGAIVLCFGITGCIGNLISIPYFGWRVKRQWNYYVLLIYLAIFDLTIVICGTFLYGINNIGSYIRTEMYNKIAFYLYPLIQIGLTGSTYFTMAISMERYFVICRPLYHWGHAYKSRMYIIPIIAFTFIYNIPSFFELRTEYCQIQNIPNLNLPEGHAIYLCNGENFTLHGCADGTICIIPTELRMNPLYYGIYHVGFSSVFLYLIPTTVLLTSNIQIFNEIIVYTKGTSPEIYSVQSPLRHRYSVYPPQQHPRERQRRKNQVARANVVLAISGIFIICNTIRISINMYEFYVRIWENHSTEADTAGSIHTLLVDIGMSISNSLVMFISCTNFYVYMAKKYWTGDCGVTSANQEINLNELSRSLQNENNDNID